MESSETWRAEALKSFTISKFRIQGVWDPTHSTRTRIIAHSSRVGIPSGCRCHYTQLRRLYTRLSPLPSRCITSGNLLPPSLHLDVLHSEFRSQMGEESVLHSAAVFSWSFLIFATDILGYFEIFCFRYLLSKSPKYPCNPPIIGFLSY